MPFLVTISRYHKNHYFTAYIYFMLLTPKEWKKMVFTFWPTLNMHSAVKHSLKLTTRYFTFKDRVGYFGLVTFENSGSSRVTIHNLNPSLLWFFPIRPIRLSSYTCCQLCRTDLNEMIVTINQQKTLNMNSFKRLLKTHLFRISFGYSVYVTFCVVYVGRSLCTYWLL